MIFALMSISSRGAFSMVWAGLGAITSARGRMVNFRYIRSFDPTNRAEAFV